MNCAKEGCIGEPFRAGCCRPHWYANSKSGLYGGEPCLGDGCERPGTYSRGLCTTHYARHRRANGKRCGFEGCDTGIDRQGLCGAHIAQRERGEELRAIREKHQWSKWCTLPDGYVARWLNPESGPRQRQLQHRYVMEQHIGRSLLPKETVHHINGVRGDNRIENLELWSSSHPKGQRVEDKLAWAREIVALYGD